MKEKSSERLFELIGEIDNEYLDEALSDAENIKSKSDSRRTIRIFASLAAAAAVMVIALSTALAHNSLKPNIIAPSPTKDPEQNSAFIDYDNLPFEYTPKTDLEKLNGGLENGGMGFEGMFAYDISELIGNNPWREDIKITELPVFTGYNRYHAFSKDKYMGLFEDISAKLGGELTDIYYDYINPDYFPPEDRELVADKVTVLSANVGNAKLEAHDGACTIEFKGDPDVYTDGYKLNNDDRASNEEAYLYLANKYSDLLGYDSFAADMIEDYSIYGEKLSTNKSVYPTSDDPFTSLMYYNFCKVRFSAYPTDREEVNSLNSANSYFSIHFSTKLSSLECCGFYPTITAEKARQLLLSGDYVTTVPEDRYPDGISEEMIEHVELVYRTNQTLTHSLPYYRFLVEIENTPAAKESLPEGMKLYGAFYVPAIEPEYIENVETEVRFN